MSVTKALPHVAIVGGGLIGSACAYYLAAAGCRVTVVERDALGGQTSTVAAGILAPSAEAEREGPFLDLACASLRLFPDLVARLARETGLALEHSRSGVVELASNDGDAAHLQARIPWLSERGLAVEWLDAPALHRLEPALAPDVRGGLLCPDGQQISGARLAQGFLAGAARRGARLIEHTPAEGLLREGGQVVGVRTPQETIPADEVVLACGAWSRFSAEWVQLDLPVVPIKGQLLALRQVPIPIKHVVFGGQVYLVPKNDGTVLLGATVEQAGFDRRVTLAGLRFLLAALPSLAPSLAEAELVAARAGLRPATPDRLPVIDRVPGQERLWVAAGHFRNGVLLAPITGTLMAQLLLGQRPELDCSPFSLSRFAVA